MSGQIRVVWRLRDVKLALASSLLRGSETVGRHAARGRRGTEKVSRHAARGRRGTENVGVAARAGGAQLG